MWLLAQTGRGRRAPSSVDLFSGEWLRTSGLRIAGIIALGIIVTVVARLIVRRLDRRLSGSINLTSEQDLQRTATVSRVIYSAVKIVLWSAIALLVVGELDINLAPLLASAGVIGVIIGFGAQSMVRDLLAGFFILLEHQVDVGNVADIHTPAGQVTGTIEAVSLRSIIVRSFDGTLHTIPNGTIQIIGNRSRGWARAVVDVRVAPTADLDEAQRALTELFEDLHARGALPGAIARPTVLGVEGLGTFEITIRCAADARPSRRVDVERELRGQIKRRLDERGIPLPAPPPTR